MIDPGLIADLYVFVLAGFLGYQVISRVSPLLHTPLMSATKPSRGSRWSDRWSSPERATTRSAPRWDSSR